MEPSPGSVEAMVERLTNYGFDARVELSPAEGEPLTVQLTRERLSLLELEEGQIVWVRAATERVFA
ncbi:MAG: TOBE-like domain-containing protein, partial [Gaiella sp.]